MTNDKRNAFLRWLLPDPVAHLPLQERMRMGLPVMVFILAGAIAARAWLGPATVLVALLVAAGLAIFAMDRWEWRAGEHMPRVEFRRRVSEETLAMPVWKLGLGYTLVFLAAGLVPQLMFAGWEGSKWPTRAGVTFSIALPIAVAFGLSFAWWLRRRAAAHLGNSR